MTMRFLTHLRLFCWSWEGKRVSNKNIIAQVRVWIPTIYNRLLRNDDGYEMTASELLPLWYLYESSLTMVLLAELFAITWTGAGAKNNHGIDKRQTPSLLWIILLCPVLQMLEIIIHPVCVTSGWRHHQVTWHPIEPSLLPANYQKNETCSESLVRCLLCTWHLAPFSFLCRSVQRPTIPPSLRRSRGVQQSSVSVPI